MNDTWGEELVLLSSSGLFQYVLPFISIAILAVGVVTISHTPALTEGEKSTWVICVVLLPLAGSLGWIIILLTH